MPRANPDVNYEISIHALLAESDARLAAFAQHGAEDFYPRSPCGERRYSLRPPPARGEISIHALLAESDHARVGVAAGAVISIHALLAESDVPRQGLGSWSSYFYPRSPCGERPRPIPAVTRVANFYPRSPCGERLTAWLGVLVPLIFLSTLSLRRATTSSRQDLLTVRFLSTLSLRRATPGRSESLTTAGFLSTLSLRRATRRQLPRRSGYRHFYPRSPCGERLHKPGLFFQQAVISIHALLAESDRCARRRNHRNRHFYPRSPCGERPNQSDLRFLLFCISIHALLAESDLWVLMGGLNFNDFYPRSPCGERPLSLSISVLWMVHFYPRSPCGERRHWSGVPVVGCPISIHALLAESDTWQRGSRITYVEFLSTLSLRRATLNCSRNGLAMRYFYPRSPCGERRWCTLSH